MDTKLLFEKFVDAEVVFGTAALEIIKGHSLLGEAYYETTKSHGRAVPGDICYYTVICVAAQKIDKMRKKGVLCDNMIDHELQWLEDVYTD